MIENKAEQQTSKTDVIYSNNIGVSIKDTKLFEVVAQVTVLDKGVVLGTINIPQFPVTYDGWKDVLIDSSYDGCILADITAAFDEEVATIEQKFIQAVCSAYGVEATNEIIVAVLVHSDKELERHISRNTVHSILETFKKCMHLYYESYNAPTFQADDTYKLYTMWRANNIKDFCPMVAKMLYNGVFLLSPFEKLFMTTDGLKMFVICEENKTNDEIVEITETVSEALRFKGYRNITKSKNLSMEEYTDIISKAVWGVTNMFKIKPII